MVQWAAMALNFSLPKGLVRFHEKTRVGARLRRFVRSGLGEWAELRLFGLKNCDTCKSALKALAAAGKSVQFVDVRADPPGRDFLAEVLKTHGAAALNTRSTTWRGLDADARARDPLDLLVAHPALMKRPVIEVDGVLYLGWTDQVRASVMA